MRHKGRFLSVLPLLFLYFFQPDRGFAMPHSLMPVPQKVTFTSQRFILDDHFSLTITGQTHPRLYTMATAMLRRLSGRTGLFFPQDYIRPDSHITSASLVVEVQRPGAVKLGEDESYRLDIDAQGIKMTAVTDLGAIRGFETLLQLLSADERGYFFPGVTIEDAPRFPWRGLLIDVGRHFMPVEVIKRNLDGMAAVKMNVLHWHLSEDQGFRVECKTFPKLHNLGSDGFYYTQEQIKEIIHYADERGIRVMPEFDIPGHSTSWLVAYPELASLPGPYTIERKFGVMDPTFDPTLEATYDFFDRFFEEMAELFPDAYMHIGGDENSGKQWDANPEIQAFMKAKHIPDNHALQSYFNNRILKILTKYHKNMVGWDEILHPDMPKNIVIHSWRGRESLVEAAKQGYQTILSNGYYIDLIQPTDFHYLNDPLPEDLPLSPQQKKFILGGEATMWSEFVTPETIDSRIWPRTAAIAERLWSSGAVQDVADMYRRLERIHFQMEELGLQHEKNYEMMLRRLANGRDISALKTFVDVVEPVKIYNRPAQRDYTSFSPMTRVVDAARPDAPVARHFRASVEKFLQKPSGQAKLAAEIKRWLTLWQQNHERLIELIPSSPVLREVESLSQDLSAISTIGLYALHSLENGAKTGAGWRDQSLATLRNARQPRAQTELMIISAIEKLVLATGE